MKAIIIDDERDSIETLTEELSSYCPSVQVIGHYENPKEGRNAIIDLTPDVVFLDIEMPRMNGFDLLASLDNINFDVIFVTAYDEYAINAFEFNATDYLLKPIMKTKLIEAVNKVREKSAHTFGRDSFDALMNNIKMQYHHGIETIALPTSDGFEFIHINDVAYIKAESNYSWVHLVTGQKYLLSKTLKQVAKIMSFPQFFRAHNSWIANLNHVKKYIRGQGGYLIMKDKVQVPVSRQRKEELMRLLVM